MRHQVHKKAKDIVGERTDFSAQELEDMKEAFVACQNTNSEGTKVEEGGMSDSDFAGRAISLPEFTYAMRMLRYGHLPLRALFRAFDVDGNGVVDFGEFLAGLEKLKADKPQAMRFIFEVMDTNKDGQISLRELE